MKISELLTEADEQIDDEPAEPMYKDEAEVKADIFPLLQEKIAKLNKRATKLSVPPVTLEVVEEFMKEKKRNRDGEPLRFPIKEKWFKIKIHGETPKLAGWKFMATIEHKDSGNVIRNVPGTEGNPAIKRYFDAKPYYCDHCKKIRSRKDTFIVANEKGQLKQVGRMCMKDFLGGKDPKAILWYFAFIDSIHKLIQQTDEEFEVRGRRTHEYVPVDVVLNIGAALIRNFGYVNSRTSQEKGMPSTSQNVGWVIFTAPYDLRKDDWSRQEKEMYEVAKAPTPADVAEAKQAFDWFMSLPQEEKDSNEFMHNVDVVLRSTGLHRRDIGFAVAVYPVYRRAMAQLKQQDPAVQARPKTNAYVGQEGQKLPPTRITVTHTRNITTDFGTSQMIHMSDDAGNLFVWFNTGRGDLEEGKQYMITGTIKKHNDYKGTKQTMLSRVRATPVQ